MNKAKALWTASKVILALMALLTTYELVVGYMVVSGDVVS